MKRQLNTKKPHDPYALYLDEDVSGPTLASHLRAAGLVAHQYETLLTKNRKIQDSRVIEVASEAGYVIVTKDASMESDWTEDIIKHKAKVILLTDDHGGVVHWASSLICGEAAWERALLDNPGEPITIRINRSGSVMKVSGEKELRQRRDKLLTARIVRAKRSHQRIA